MSTVLDGTKTSHRTFKKIFCEVESIIHLPSVSVNARKIFWRKVNNETVVSYVSLVNNKSAESCLYNRTLQVSWTEHCKTNIHLGGQTQFCPNGHEFFCLSFAQINVLSAQIEGSTAPPP